MNFKFGYEDEQEQFIHTHKVIVRFWWKRNINRRGWGGIAVKTER